MLCRNCGAELRENAKFCNNCGHPTGAETAAPQPPAYASQAEEVEYPSTEANLAVTFLSAIILTLTVMAYFLLPLVSLNTDSGLSGMALNLFVGEKSFSASEVYGGSAHHDAIVSAASELGIIDTNDRRF